MVLDELDSRILELFATEPRVGVLEASRRLGVARGTVQSRLHRMTRERVILEIRQGLGHEAVARHLAAIPEVLEAHTITGAGDLLVRVVARSNADLQRVIDVVVDDAHVLRTSTLIALDTQVSHRVLPLVRAAAR